MLNLTSISDSYRLKTFVRMLANATRLSIVWLKILRCCIIKHQKRIRSFIPILIPLFASSFKRADALAIAMEARGYKGGEGRTRYRTLQWGVKDNLALLVILCLMLIVFYLKNG